MKVKTNVKAGDDDPFDPNAPLEIHIHIPVG